MTMTTASGNGSNWRWLCINVSIEETKASLMDKVHRVSKICTISYVCYRFLVKTASFVGTIRSQFGTVPKSAIIAEASTM
ncbi:hypothetical protein RB195_002863 [Necator americanus]|uniref:Uncharacterized protein n=1 Tax=Necator americanus TaxID=51031 RepID=A0ABR1DL08_NECAM